MKKELRYFVAEIRAEGGEERRVSGYAAVFNKLSEVLYNFREKIAPGAFKRSLKENDILALWSHNPDIPIGRTSSNTLSLSEDDTGLRFSLDLPDSPWGHSAYTAISRGDVKGVSFGFMVREDEWKRGEEGKPHIRTLKDVDLIEISPTAFPAYPQTSVSARDLQSVVEEQEARWAIEDGDNSIYLAKLRLAGVE